MFHFIRAILLYATFSGRATREEYWMFTLIYFLIYIALLVIAAEFHSTLLLTLFSLFIFIPGIAVTTRRLHDTGRSGWWQLIYLLPLIGLIVMFIFLVQPSQETNEYGKQPLI